MNKKLHGMSVATQRITKLVAPVILVVVRSLGDRLKDVRYRPGRVTLRVALGQKDITLNERS